MGAETIIEKLRRIFWYEPLEAIEYFFAKRWLDKTFGMRVGRQEYWGDFIQELIYQHSIKKEKIKDER